MSAPPPPRDLDDVAPIALLPGPGEQLRTAREAAGLSVHEISAHLRLDSRVIQALEADDYAKLPAPTFIRGYLRGYARFLDIDPEPVIRAFEQRDFTPPALVADISERPQVQSTDFPVRMVTYVVVAALVLLVVLWWRSQDFAPVGFDLMPADDPARSEADGAATGSEPEASAPAEPGPEADGPASPQPEADAPAAGGTDRAGAPQSAGAAARDEAPQSAPPDAGETPAPPTPSQAAENGSGDDAPADGPARSEADGAATGSEPEANAPAGPGPEADEPASPQPEADAPAAGGTDRAGAPQSAGAAARDEAPQSAPPNAGETPAPPAPSQAAENGSEGGVAPGSSAEDPPAPPAVPAGDERPLGGGVGPDRLEVSFDNECWVEIYDHAHERLFYDLVQPGQSLVVNGTGPIRVVLGNVTGIEVVYNGTPIDFAPFAARGVARFSVGGEPPAAFETPAPEPAGEHTGSDRQT